MTEKQLKTAEELKRIIMQEIVKIPIAAASRLSKSCQRLNNLRRIPIGG